MLVLTRRTTQTLLIGDNVTLTVLEVRGDRVRFGLTVPHDVRVRRVDKSEHVAGLAPAPPGNR